jgi:hypothetical protein
MEVGAVSGVWTMKNVALAAVLLFGCFFINAKFVSGSSSGSSSEFKQGGTSSEQKKIDAKLANGEAVLLAGWVGADLIDSRLDPPADPLPVMTLADETIYRGEGDLAIDSTRRITDIKQHGGYGYPFTQADGTMVDMSEQMETGVLDGKPVKVQFYAMTMCADTLEYAKAVIYVAEARKIELFTQNPDCYHSDAVLPFKEGPIPADE